MQTYKLQFVILKTSLQEEKFQILFILLLAFP